MATRPFEQFQWPVPPDFIERTCAHIAATGEPEGVAGLHPGPIAKDEPFLIIRHISIPREKRTDGTMASCPMCQPNKYLEGRLVYFTQLQAVAAIGHCCAARDTNLAAEREYRAREAKARAEEELLTGLPLLPALLEECRALAPRVAAAQTLMTEFRGRGAAFQRTLRQAIKGSGLLTVTEILGPRAAVGPAGMRTSGSTIDTRDVQFGLLTGPAAVASQCHVAQDHDAVLALLIRFPRVTGDDMILEFLGNLSDEALSASAKAIRDARKKLAALYTRLDELAAFFTAANAARITQWGSHRDAPIKLRASCRLSRCGTQVEFEIVGGQGRRLGLLIPSEFWPGGQRPMVL